MNLKGKFVLVPFPFTNLKATKLRPALVLYEGKEDVVVAFVSSRIDRFDPDTDVKIEPSHPQFRSTGLKVPSIIELTKIATLHKDLLIGVIGELPEDLVQEVNTKLCSNLRIGRD